MSALRVVLDTNVLLSGIAFPASTPGKIVAAWRNGSLHVVLSDYILDELRRVLPRLKNRHGMSAIEMADFVDLLALHLETVVPLALHEPMLTDANDQPVLATLLAANAECLITDDKALLARADKYAIVTPAVFWARHGAG